MSYDSQSDGNFEEMLKAILGEQAAEHIMDQFRSSGIDPSEQLDKLADPANYAQVLSQIQAMIGSSGDGAVNWKVGEHVARDALNRKGSSAVTAAEGERVRRALSTASLWLDPVTEIGPCTGPNQVWSRFDFIAHCLATYRKLTEPVGENVARAFRSALADQAEDIPEDIFAGLGASTTQMMDSMTASLMGMQYGTALAELAGISFGSSDAGLPLVEGHTAAIVPANVSAFAEGIDDGKDEVELFVAVREQASARLYSHVPWLRPQILDAVAAYASQIQIDMDSIERQIREAGFDIQNMSEINLAEVFEAEPNPTQQAMLGKLEHVLSLVEGWISAVSLDAVVSQLPHAVALSELFGRRIATQSPVNRTFGPLVGLDIAPRRVREATAFWRMARSRMTIAERDALWNHPDLLPTPEQLANPASFFDKPAASAVEDELDAFLAQILEEADNEGDAEGPKPSEG